MRRLRQKTHRTCQTYILAVFSSHNGTQFLIETWFSLAPLVETRALRHWASRFATVDNYLACGALSCGRRFSFSSKMSIDLGKTACKSPNRAMFHPSRRTPKDSPMDTAMAVVAKSNNMPKFLHRFFLKVSDHQDS